MRTEEYKEERKIHSNSPAYALYSVHFAPVLTPLRVLGLHTVISFVASGAIPYNNNNNNNNDDTGNENCKSYIFKSSKYKYLTCVLGQCQVGSMMVQDSGNGTVLNPKVL